MALLAIAGCHFKCAKPSQCTADEVNVSGVCSLIPVDGGPDDSGPFVTIPLTGCPFLGFDAPVAIDSQSFELDVDTGSTTTFVAGASCGSCGVTPEYDASQGTDENSPANSVYGSGMVDGTKYSDTVQVGDEMPSVRMDFGVIASQQGFFLPASCSGTSPKQQGEGILGLGPIILSAIGTQANDAYFTELVASSMGLANVFAVNLCTQNGNLWFGGYDMSFASGPVSFTPLEPMNFNQPYWEIGIESIGLGGSTIPNSAGPNTVVDTGTGDIMLPTAAYNSIVSSLSSNSGADSVFGPNVLTASFFNQGGCVSPTGGQSQSQVDAALPALTVTLPSTSGGTFALTMPASQSYLTLVQGQYCASIADGMGTTVWGAPGLRAYITVFDVGSARIGFASQDKCE